MFILQSQTTQDQLLTVEALAKGYPPPNGQQFIAEFERVAEYLRCSHLLHEAFNKTTFCMPQDDPRSILAEKLRATKADNSTGMQLESDEPKVSLKSTQQIYFEDPIKVVEEAGSPSRSQGRPGENALTFGQSCRGQSKVTTLPVWMDVCEWIYIVCTSECVGLFAGTTRSTTWES